MKLSLEDYAFLMMILFFSSYSFFTKNWVAFCGWIVSLVLFGTLFYTLKKERQ